MTVRDFARNVLRPSHSAAPAAAAARFDTNFASPSTDGDAFDAAWVGARSTGVPATRCSAFARRVCFESRRHRGDGRAAPNDLPSFRRDCATFDESGHPGRRS